MLRPAQKPSEGPSSTIHDERRVGPCEKCGEQRRWLVKTRHRDDETVASCTLCGNTKPPEEV